MALSATRLSAEAAESVDEPPSPFAGFWMGGFEGADAVDDSGCTLDLARDSGHLARLEEDHRRAAQAGLRGVRENIGWRVSEDGDGHIDLGRALRVQASARRHGLQVLWTLVHHGLPQGLSLHDDALVSRLARFADEVARVLGPGEGTLPSVFTPIHGIGLLGGGCCDKTRRLVRAALAAMVAIERRLPHARFLHVEPLAGDGSGPTPWQVWDLIAGRAEPALGGRPRWLDLIGVHHGPAGGDARPRRLRTLLAETWLRYHRPLLLAETGAGDPGPGRAAHLHDTASEVRHAQAVGVPVLGLCLYPLVDRPDAQLPQRWHRNGLWHVDSSQASLPRRIEPELHGALRQWQQVLPQPLPQADLRPARVLIAFSARPWDSLRHRTQHLLQGLADAGRGWRVVVVEAPRPASRPRLESIACGSQLEVLVPYTPAREPGFHPGPCLALQRLLCDWLATQGVRHHSAWLSTPMAWPLARALRPESVVYDCLSELSGVRGAPPELAQLEAELLATANLVCAASAPLAAARAAAAGARLHALPNGVDADFFKPRDTDADAPLGLDEEEAALAAAPLWQADGPQLGYAGAIDERIDLALLAHLADTRPHWQFVLVGPVLGIDPATLPRRRNLHWLGAVPYRLLPALMAHWQLMLLPFVRSAATWRARPQQVLEALAMSLPVVASPLPELEAWSAAGVTTTRHAADGRTLDPAAFLQACEGALAETPAACGARQRAARRVARGASWNGVVRRLVQLLEPPAPGTVAMPQPALAAAAPPPARRPMQPALTP